MGDNSLGNPKRRSFLAFYQDPKSETFGNVLRSALKAGYKQQYAENLTSHKPNWLVENLGNDKSVSMLEKAERNIDEMLDMETERTVYTKEGKEYKKLNTEVLKVKADVTKFVAERIGRSKFGAKAEIVNSNTNIQINILNYGGNNNPASVPAETLPTESTGSN